MHCALPPLNVQCNAYSFSFSIVTLFLNSLNLTKLHVQNDRGWQRTIWSLIFAQCVILYINDPALIGTSSLSDTCCGEESWVELCMKVWIFHTSWFCNETTYWELFLIRPKLSSHSVFFTFRGLSQMFVSQYATTQWPSGSNNSGAAKNWIWLWLIIHMSDAIFISW